MIEKEAFHTSKATVSAIVLATNKTFISEHLLNKDGKRPVEVMKGKKLHQVMDKFMTLSSPNVRNLVASFKHWLGNRGYISNILIFKANNVYYFIKIIVFQGNRLKKMCFCSRFLCMEMLMVVI
jgi:hypothetical protein